MMELEHQGTLTCVAPVQRPGKLIAISSSSTPRSLCADSLDIRVTVSVHGVPGSTASAHPDAANAAMAVLLNLGADGSRRVSSGIATWHGVSVVGWPGAYRLAFRATAKAAHVAVSTDCAWPYTGGGGLAIACGCHVQTCTILDVHNHSEEALLRGPGGAG